MKVFLKAVNYTLSTFGRGDTPEECVQELQAHGNTHKLPILAKIWDKCMQYIHLQADNLALETAVQNVLAGKRAVHVCKSGFTRIRKGIQVSEQGRPCWVQHVAFCCAVRAGWDGRGCPA